MKRGEIYIVDLGPGVGYEASGAASVVVLSEEVNNPPPLLVTVLPCVDPSHLLAPLGTLLLARDSGHPVDVVVLSRQPRTLDASRFTAGPVGAYRFSLQTYLDLDNVSPPSRP